MKKFKLVANAAIMGSLLIMNASFADEPDEIQENGTAYYADATNDLVYVIDVDEMQLEKVIQADVGSKPYPIDRANDQKTYVSTRNSYSIGVIDNFDLDLPMGAIALTHKPRSTSYNSRRGLALVSGADAAYSSVIKVNRDKVKRVVGQGEVWDPQVNTDFGGSNATGHPFWHKANRFFQLNRPAKKLELYHKNGTLLDSIELPTTAHHLLRAPASVYGRKARNTYFMALEGNPSQGVTPGLMRFKIKHNKIIITGIVWLDCSDCDPADMGGHHADISPDGGYIFMGSREGHMFVIDSMSMYIVAVLPTGTGSGHTRFVAGRDLALVTNHNDTFMTVIDTYDLTVVANIEVSDSCNLSGLKTIGHTTGLSPSEKYVYGVASCTGQFFRIDLDSFEVDTLDLTQQVIAMGVNLPTGVAYPIQGAAYFWE